MDLDSARIRGAITESGIEARGAGSDPRNRAIGGERGTVRCLRCNSLTTIALDKMAADANTCYLCRACGHIFSPSTPGAVVQR